MSDYTQLSLDLEPEIWKPIPDYEALYEVSNKGRVRRLAGTPQCHNNRLRKLKQTRGYSYVSLRREGKGKNRYVHHLVLAAFEGTIPAGHEVNHKNGIKTDNRLENLEYVTHSQNELHSFRVLGNMACHGEAHPSAKLTAKNVRQIRKLIGTISNRALARQFGVSPTAIEDIRDRVTWKHVK